MEYLINLARFTTYLQLATVLIIFINYKKFNRNVLRYFPFLFLYTALNEFIAKFLHNYLHLEGNFIFFNVFFFINFSYFFYLMHHVLRGNYKLIPKVFYVLYLILLIIEIFILKSDYEIKSQYFPYLTAAIGILVSILFFLIQVILSPEVIVIQKKITFWIVLAYFTYFSGMLVFKMAQKHLGTDQDYFYIYNIPILVTIILNIILIFGALWSGTEKSSSYLV